MTTITRDDKKLKSNVKEYPNSLDRIVLYLEYDGSRYHGYQMQDDTIPTIQRALETALLKLTKLEHRVTSASRTDRGVSASRQIVSVPVLSSHIGIDTYLPGLNHYLPDDIVVNEVFLSPPNFHVRNSATSRVYQYVILNRKTRPAIDRTRAAHISEKLDTESMMVAIQCMTGWLDIRPFTGTLDNPENYLRRFDKVLLSRDNDAITIEIEASGFVMHQIRRTVGAIVKVGLGEMSIGDFQSLVLHGKPGQAKSMMPSEGLCLIDVKYDDFPPKEERN